MRNYLDTFRHWRFALMWGGISISSLGDGLTNIALLWLTYQLRHSALDVGILEFCYSAPVVIGGPMAGIFLDRIGARRAMLLDNLIRGIAVGLVPLLYRVGALRPWHIFAIAAVYGLLKMITIAGSPTLLPSLVPEEHLNTANAMESIGYSAAAVLGAPTAGLLLSLMSGANVLLLDAASYFLLVLALLAIGGGATGARPAAGAPAPSLTAGAPGKPASPAESLRPALSFSVGNPFIRSTTVMYTFLNAGWGILGVLWPVLLLNATGNNSRVLGLVAGVLAAGDLLGSFLAGAIRWPEPYSRLITWSLILSGVPLLALVFDRHIATLAIALALSEVIQAPLTPWAQTERMRLIPQAIRGRVFALLRTVMLSGPAIGAAIGAQVVTGLPAAAAVGLGVALISGPGIVGLLAPHLLATKPTATAATAAS